MNKLTAHLDDVGESYFQHLRHASSFAAAMTAGGIACLVHAIFPFLFEKTGSDYIRALHDRMVINRRELSQAAEAGATRQA